MDVGAPAGPVVNGDRVLEVAVHGLGASACERSIGGDVANDLDVVSFAEYGVTDLQVVELLSLVGREMPPLRKRIRRRGVLERVKYLEGQTLRSSVLVREGS